MASPVGCASSEYCLTDSASPGGLMVLNAASRPVLERTIVEAFVKLVVCRRVTVQQVAVTSGLVLDSHTTQEEDSPVILEVHRHEVGADCTTRSCPQPSVSDVVCPDHSRSPRCSSSSQLRDSQDLRCQEKAGEDKGDGRRHSCSSCFPSWRKEQSTNDLQKHPEAESETHRPVKIGKRRKLGLHGLAGTVCKRFSSIPDQEQSLTSDVQLLSSLGCERTGQDVNSCNGAVCDSVDSCEAGQSREIIADADDSYERSEESLEGGVERCEGLAIKTSCPAASNEGHRLQVPMTRKDSRPEEFKVDEQHSMPPGERQDLIDDTSAEMPGEQRGDKNGEESEEQSSHSCAMTSVGEQDEEMPTLGNNHTEAGAAGESMNVQWAVNHQSTVAPKHTSCSQASAVNCKDKTAQEEHEMDITSRSPKKISTSPDEMNRDASEGKRDSESSTCVQESNQPMEYDTEQDMLVIDISSTMFEQTSQSTDSEQTQPDTDRQQTQTDTDRQQIQSDTDKEQTHPHTDVTNSEKTPLDTNSKQAPPDSNDIQTPPNTNNRQTPPDTNSEKSPPDADSQQIHQGTHSNSHDSQNTEDCVPISGPEQRAHSGEKPDPFFHLLTNFPVGDRSYSKESLPSGYGRTNPQRNRTTSDSSACLKIPKEEPDDDCMITAAFISPSRERRSETHRSATHMLINQSAALSAASRRSSRGGMTGTPMQRRNSQQHGQYHPSAFQQFQHAQGYQVNPAVAAEAPGTSAISYQSRASSSSHVDSPVSSTALHPTSQAYLPNFLATTPEVSEHVDCGTVLSAPEDGGRLHVDFSQTHQCPVCNKIFMHESKFLRHTAMCGGRRPFKCKMCGKAFNQRAHLDTHMKFHMGIKRYRCEVCRKAYVMKGDLIRHQKTRAHLLVLQSYGLPVQ